MNRPKYVMNRPSRMEISEVSFNSHPRFPFFSVLLWYNHLMTGYFFAQKPDVSCVLHLIQ